MNRFIFLTLILLSAGASAKDSVAVLSPYGTSNEVQKRVSVVQQHLSQMDSGDTLTVLSGADGETIATFTIPDVPDTHKVKAIRGVNKKAIGQIGAFVKCASGEHRTGTINLPVVLNQLAAYHRDKIDVLLLGSLSFDLPNMSKAIASGQHLPADNNLLKTSQESTFGTRNLGERFKGYRFHWWISEKAGAGHHYEGAIRFWFMHLNFQGGGVVSITHDKAVVLKRLKDNAQPLISNYQLQVENADFPATLFDEALAPVTAAKDLNTRQRVSVAIGWESSAADLDIYALAAAQTMPVYYNNPVNQTPQARHLKDIRSGASFETILYDEVIDGCDLTIAVNLYSGTAEKNSVSGTLRFAVGDVVFEKPFTITAVRGNGGRDVTATLNSQTSTDHTLIFTLSDITDAGCER